MATAQGSTRRSRLGALEALPDIVRPEKAFEVLEVSKPFGYALLKRGELRGVRLGGRLWRIPKAELYRILGIEKPV